MRICPKSSRSDASIHAACQKAASSISARSNEPFPPSAAVERHRQEIRDIVRRHNGLNPGFSAPGRAAKTLKASDLDLLVDHAGEGGVADAERPRPRRPGQVSFGGARADRVQRLSGDDVDIPGLDVHRRGRAHRQADDLLDQRPGNRIGLLTAEASATENDVIVFHGGSQTGALGGTPSEKRSHGEWIAIGSEACQSVAVEPTLWRPADDPFGSPARADRYPY